MSEDYLLEYASSMVDAAEGSVKPEVSVEVVRRSLENEAVMKGMDSEEAEYIASRMAANALEGNHSEPESLAEQVNRY